MKTRWYLCSCGSAHTHHKAKQLILSSSRLWVWLVGQITSLPSINIWFAGSSTTIQKSVNNPEKKSPTWSWEPWLPSWGRGSCWPAQGSEGPGGKLVWGAQRRQSPDLTVTWPACRAVHSGKLVFLSLALCFRSPGGMWRSLGPASKMCPPP